MAFVSPARRYLKVRGEYTPSTKLPSSLNDGVPISALFGASESAERVPTVILPHDLGGDKQVWLTTTDLFIELLERGYAVVAVDMRGHGQTPLPDNRQVLLIEDLEKQRARRIRHAKLAVGTARSGSQSHRCDRRWIRWQRSVCESSGVFTEQIKTSVTLARALGGILLESSHNRAGHFSFCASVHSLLGGGDGPVRRSRYRAQLR